MLLEIVFGIFDLLLIGGYILWDTLKIYEDKTIAFQWFVVFQFSVLIAYLLARSQVERSKIEKRINGIRTEIAAIRPLLSHNTTTLKQENFYSEIRQDIEEASASVDLAHLDTRPPHDAALARSDMERYYNDFIKTVRRLEKVRFRRVERVSKEKKPWLESLVERLQGYPNFSLACLILPDDARKVPHVSVQLIDGRKTYLVAVKEHVDAHAPRDICINDPLTSSIWLEYYNKMLWERSLPIIDNGSLNSENWKQIQKNWDN